MKEERRKKSTKAASAPATNAEDVKPAKEKTSKPQKTRLASEQDDVKTSSPKKQKTNPPAEQNGTTTEKSSGEQITQNMTALLQKIQRKKLVNIHDYQQVNEDFLTILADNAEHRLEGVSLVLQALAEKPSSAVRPVYAALLATILSSYNAEDVSTQEVEKKAKSLFEKEKNTDKLIGNLYFIAALLQSKRITTQEQQEQYLKVLTKAVRDAPEESDSEDEESSSKQGTKPSVAVLAKSIIAPFIEQINADEIHLRQLLKKHVKPIIGKEPKSLDLSDFALLQVIAKRCEDFITEDLKISSVSKTFFSSTHLLSKLLENQQHRSFFGKSSLWEFYFKHLGQASEAVVQAACQKVNETFFVQLIEPKTLDYDLLERVSMGFEIAAVAVRNLPATALKFLLTKELLWHVAFVVDRDRHLAKSLSNSKLKDGKYNIIIRRFLSLGGNDGISRMTILKQSESVDTLLNAMYHKSSSNPECGREMLSIIVDQPKNVSSELATVIANIKAQLPKTGTDLKTLLEKFGKGGITHFIPKSLSKLKNLDADDIFDALKYLFYNGIYSSSSTEKLGEFTPSTKKTFANQFFSVLNTLTKFELEYYEKEQGEKGFSRPWSERFGDLYTASLIQQSGKKPDQLVTPFTDENLLVRESVQKSLGKLNAATTSTNKLQVAGIKLLLQRILLYQVAEPSLIDETIAEDISQYVDKVFSKVPAAAEPAEAKDDTEPVETLTDVLVYLLKNEHFTEIAVFILLQQKSQLTDGALDIMVDAVLRGLGIHEDEAEDMPEDEEMDEEASAENGKKEADDESDSDSDSSDEEEAPKQKAKGKVEEKPGKKKVQIVSDKTDEEEKPKEAPEVDEDTYATARDLEEDAEDDRSSVRTLGDDEMFQMDEALSAMFKKKSAMENPAHLAQFGIRVVNILESLFLFSYNEPKPENNRRASRGKKVEADMKVDKKFKFKIYIRFIEILLRTMQGGWKADNNNTQLYNRVVKVIEGIQTDKYKNFLTQTFPMFFPNRIMASNPSLAPEDKVVPMEKKITGFTSEIGEQLVAVLEQTLPIVISADKSSKTFTTLTSTIKFIVPLLYFQESDEWAKKTVEVIANALPLWAAQPSYPSLMELLNENQFIGPDLVPKALELFGTPVPVYHKYMYCKILSMQFNGKFKNAFAGNVDIRGKALEKSVETMGVCVTKLKQLLEEFKKNKPEEPKEEAEAEKGKQKKKKNPKKEKSVDQFTNSIQYRLFSESFSVVQFVLKLKVKIADEIPVDVGARVYKSLHKLYVDEVKEIQPQIQEVLSKSTAKHVLLELKQIPNILKKLITQLETANNSNEKALKTIQALPKINTRDITSSDNRLSGTEKARFNPNI